MFNNFSVGDSLSGTPHPWAAPELPILNRVKRICIKPLLFKNGKAKLKWYYENNKERLQEQARNSYRNLSEEKEKTKKENMEERDKEIV